MADVPWHLSGDYFENCSCSIVCPCLVSAAPPLASRPTEGFCNVPLIFHVESGRYGDIALDGLNILVILHAPGVMADIGHPVARAIVTQLGLRRRTGEARASCPAGRTGLWRRRRHGSGRFPGFARGFVRCRCRGSGARIKSGVSPPHLGNSPSYAIPVARIQDSSAEQASGPHTRSKRWELAENAG